MWFWVIIGDATAPVLFAVAALAAALALDVWVRRDLARG